MKNLAVITRRRFYQTLLELTPKSLSEMQKPIFFFFYRHFKLEIPFKVVLAALPDWNSALFSPFSRLQERCAELVNKFR